MTTDIRALYTRLPATDRLLRDPAFSAVLARYGHAQVVALLRQMLECALDLPPREASEAVLQGFDAPLSEWVMARFLAALQHLVKRGVRSDYLRIEGEERFLRGQLDVVRQMRQPLQRCGATWPNSCPTRA